MAEHVFGVVGFFRQPHPENIDGRAEIFDLKSSALANDRVAAGGPARQYPAHLERTARRSSADAHNATVFNQQIGRLITHQHAKRRKFLSFFGQKIQKIPLRHQRDELAVRWQARKIPNICRCAIKPAADLRVFLMLPRKETFEEAEFPHHFERRGVNRVAAKIAEKIAVFFEYDNVNAGPGKQIAGHYTGWTAAHDTNASLDVFGRWRVLVHRLHGSTLRWIQAEITLFWNRRAAMIRRNVPIAKSARPSVQRCLIVAPRRMTPRVILMKYVAGIR